MIKSIFDEKFDEGFAVGEARGEARAVLTFLRAKFNKVPKGIEKAIRSMTDTTALNSLAVRAATCKSMDEFATALH